MLVPGCVLTALLPVYILALARVRRGLFAEFVEFAEAYMVVQIFLGAVLCPWVLVVAIRDRLTGETRDWLHWLGVAVFTLLSAMGVLDGLFWLGQR